MCLSDFEPFVEISIAVVKRAADDYRHAVKYLYRHRNDKHKSKTYLENEWLKNDAKGFLLSENMWIYFELDGVDILRRLNKELDKWKKEYIKTERAKNYA